MAWKKLRRGVWTKWAPLDRLDPYLVWADTTGFADFRPNLWRASQRDTYPPVTTIPVLVELKVPFRAEPKVGAADAFGIGLDPLKVLTLLLRNTVLTGFSFVPTGFRFVTLEVTPAFFEFLAKNPAAKKFFRRIELSMPVTPGRDGIRPFEIASVQAATETAIGVIDDGCPFAHARFRKTGADREETRLLAIWDQDGRLGSPTNSPRGLVQADELNEFIRTSGPAMGRPIDETLCYESAGYTRLRRRATHGAAVLDVLAGPVPARARTWGPLTHPPTFDPESSGAAAAEIVFVQLPRAAVQDNSGKWLGKQVLDGLRMICHQTRDYQRVVANISYGPQTGPHDGSSLLERAIDEMHVLMEQQGRSLAVTLPTGNSFNNRSHARFSLPARARQELVWQVPPASEAAAFLEIWLPQGCPRDAVAIEVLPPGGKSERSGKVKPGQMRVWPSSAAPSAAVIFLDEVPQSNRRTMILVALAPTFGFDPERPIAPSGRWIVRVYNTSKRKVRPINAYIARNGTDLGASRRGRESHFVDPCFDPIKYLREADDDDKPRTSVIRRRGSISGLATGARTYAMSGYRRSDGKFAPYASSGPAENLKNPDWTAVTEEGYSLPGLRAAGTRSGSFVRFAGTSVAAPQQGRRIVDRNSTVALPPEDRERAGQGFSPLP